LLLHLLPLDPSPLQTTKKRCLFVIIPIGERVNGYCTTFAKILNMYRSQFRPSVGKFVPENIPADLCRFSFICLVHLFHLFLCRYPFNFCVWVDEERKVVQF
jgi:hypothetical protein